MEVLISEGPQARKKVSVRCTAEESRAARVSALKRVQKEAKLPGFRKGKVPPEMLEKRFPSEIKDAVVRELLPQALEEESKQGRLKIAADPILEKVEEDAQGLLIEALCSVMPEIPTLPLDKMKRAAPKVEVKDEDLNQALAQVQAEFATREDKGAGKPGEGDEVEVDLDGQVGGKPAPGGPARGYVFRLGAGTVFPEVEAAVRDLEAGGEAEVRFQYPPDFQRKDMAGKPALFKVKLGKVYRRVPAPLNDDLARKTGAADLAALKEDLSKRVKEAKESQARSQVVREVLEELLKNLKFGVPVEWVQHEAEHALPEVLGLMRTEGKDPGKDEATALEAYNRAGAMAETQIRINLLLQALADQQGVEVSDEEIARAVQADEGLSAQSVIQGLERRGELQRVRSRIRQAKAGRLLYSLVTGNT